MEPNTGHKSTSQEHALIYYGRLTNDNIKIGHAVNLVGRASVLTVNRTTGTLVGILGIHDGDYETEAEMHRLFAHLRIGAPGCPEDFRPNDELIDHILRECQPCPEVDAANRAIALRWLRSKTATPWRLSSVLDLLVQCQPMNTLGLPAVFPDDFWKD